MGKHFDIHDFIDLLPKLSFKCNISRHIEKNASSHVPIILRTFTSLSRRELYGTTLARDLLRSKTAYCDQVWKPKRRGRIIPAGESPVVSQFYDHFSPWKTQASEQGEGNCYKRHIKNINAGVHEGGEGVVRALYVQAGKVLLLPVSSSKRDTIRINCVSNYRLPSGAEPHSHEDVYFPRVT
jgi:hypothetical protein